jgi:hypothetical protein
MHGVIPPFSRILHAVLLLSGTQRLDMFTSKAVIWCWPPLNIRGTEEQDAGSVTQTIISGQWIGDGSREVPSLPVRLHGPTAECHAIRILGLQTIVIGKPVQTLLPLLPWTDMYLLWQQLSNLRQTFEYVWVLLSRPLRQHQYATHLIQPGFRIPLCSTECQ